MSEQKNDGHKHMSENNWWSNAYEWTKIMDEQTQSNETQFDEHKQQSENWLTSTHPSEENDEQKHMIGEKMLTNNKIWMKENIDEQQQQCDKQFDEQKQLIATIITNKKQLSEKENWRTITAKWSKIFEEQNIRVKKEMTNKTSQVKQYVYE